MCLFLGKFYVFYLKFLFLGKYRIIGGNILRLVLEVVLYLIVRE